MLPKILHTEIKAVWEDMSYTQTYQELIDFTHVINDCDVKKKKN